MKKREQNFGHKVKIIGNRCYRCKHEWRPREINVLPEVCPKCKSPYWNKPKKGDSDE